ncbi:MAG: glycosyltransferase family 2 protein, partial [Thermoleophilia bacterium]|nr:glycosyltransferase family 2 protein [Thermoleophilia bacterium]
MPAPTVTAMMLVRDRADLLAQAAQSVLAQTRGDFELVILDDGSTDATWSVAEALAAGDDRVRLLRNERSVGIPAARNQVIAAARGRYLATCDSDDVSRPERFAQQVALLDDSPHVVGVGGRIALFVGDTPDEGSAEPDWHWGLRDGRLPFAFPGAMLRLDAVRAVGGFDTGFAVAEGLQLSYRLAGVGGAFAAVDAVVLDYRVHAGSITARRAVTREWCTPRAQLRGVRELRGRLSARGYAVIVQSAARVVL